jgi:Cu-Zn family superoxide dismutase
MVISPSRRWLTILVLVALGAIGPVATLAQDATTVTESGARLYAIPGEAVFPEGIALADDDKTFYVGSTSDGALFRGDLATGEVAPFAAGAAPGLTFAVGMKVVGDRLVVAGGPTGSVFVFDTATETLAAEIPTGVSGGAEIFLNDVAIAKKGEAYVTDSNWQRIYRIRSTVIAGEDEPAATLTPWLELSGDAIPEGEASFINGIVLNASGRYLLVVDGPGALYRIATRDKAVVRVDLGGEQLTGGDGLVLDGSTLYVVHQDMVTVVELADDLASGAVVGRIVDPALSSPTTAAKHGACLLVVNSQFANAEEPELPFTVAAIPIPAEFPGEEAEATTGEC